MRLLIISVCVVAWSFSAGIGQAAEAGLQVHAGAKGKEGFSNYVPAMPHTVVLNQQNAHVFVKTALPVIIAHERKVVVLPLPKGARDVELNLAKGVKQSKLLSWVTEYTVPFAPQGSLEKQRVTFESMHDSLQGALTTLRAEEAFILHKLEEANVDKSHKVFAELRPRLALVGTRISSAQREISYAAKRAEALKDAYPHGKQLVIHVDTPLKKDEKLDLEYSYVLDGAYWRPKYSINANTAAGTIEVALKADIVQNSDLDWENIRLELSTAAGDAQSPMPLRPWVVSKRDNAARAYGGMARDNLVMSASYENSAAPKMRAPSFDDGSTIAHWLIEKTPKISEGNTTLLLTNYTWKSPLERVTRPAQDNGIVWISAKHTLDGNFLPVGEAIYKLDGMTVGKDVINPVGDTLQMYFGADPLVRVETKRDTRKSSEDGIINKQQSYNFGWVYTLYNKRSTAVTVNLEEPMTELEDAAMSVKYDDNPKPEQAPDKTFIWKLSVPAKGEAKVDRKVTIMAPADMRIWLGR